MNEYQVRAVSEDMVMRRVLWNWLMDQKWQADPVGKAVIRPDYSIMAVSDDEVRADLRRILLPRRKFLGLF